MPYQKLNNLFLQQSYIDAWDDYERSLRKSSFIKWDYIVLTASNEEQAFSYRQQIEYRLKNGLLPMSTKYVVLSDPNGKRVGSGGATFNVLKYIAENDNKDDIFKDKRILVIHSGGDSKRVPQYSANGKLFSPVPRELPNGRGSTLFDEFIIAMSSFPSRIKDGMLVLSGDVLLLFNPLQIDFNNKGAAAISMKLPLKIGKNHGVFLNDGKDNVKLFLHKQSENRLMELGAVNDNNCVDLDTGAVLFSSEILNDLYSLISTDNKVDNDKFNEFVNEDTRISFYGDFLYPLAKDSTLENYYKETAEGEINDNLLACRTKIWNALSKYSLKLLCLSPAKFIHFGTTYELLKLVTKDIKHYDFLQWQKQITTNALDNENYAVYNSYVNKDAEISNLSYLEHSFILNNCTISENTIISSVKLENMVIPSNTVIHGLKLTNQKFVVRTYGIFDNPKGTYEENTAFLNSTLKSFMQKNNLSFNDIWNNKDYYLWFANLYPVCDTMEEALYYVSIIHKMSEGIATNEEIMKWQSANRMSLYSSFNSADVIWSFNWQINLENIILAKKFIECLNDRKNYTEAISVFGKRGLTKGIFDELIKESNNSDFSTKIRIYFTISKFMKDHKITFDSITYDQMQNLCFRTIQNHIYNNAVRKLNPCKQQIKHDIIDIKLPVRVNWGGGWTDTPPYCIENGGVVLNAAIKLNGILPIQVTVKKLKEPHIEFESADIGVSQVFYSIDEIQNCSNPFDLFALHKASLIACGIIPISEKKDLKSILNSIGGGIYLSTQVVGVPKGSGLGTSSILSAACVMALYKFMGIELDNSNIYDIVLCMEQIMSTGGGWQDQVGGITNGIKFITTKPGINQNIKVDMLDISEQTKNELQDRFALIYTGQRRLARNLLREVVGNYILAKPDAINALSEMRHIAALMKFELEQGSIDNFAKLMNLHWELSKKLDKGSTNTCIDQMFLACEGLIDGQFIAGAGGGGFLQVILKKGVTKSDLNERLHSIFQDSGVKVWDSEFIY